MADVLIYHPETQATVQVPEVAVFHYRQSGWVLQSEHQANQAAADKAAARAAKSTEEK